MVSIIYEIVNWGLNQVYYDVLLRERLEIGFTKKYIDKVSNLDVGHLEDSKTQDLITKVRDTYNYELPVTVKFGNFIFLTIVGLISAGVTLIQFGWWIPIVIILSAIPRMYLRVKHSGFVWSIFGGNVPEARKLWYTRWLLTANMPILETRIFEAQEPLKNKFNELQEHLYKRNKMPLDKYKWITITFPFFEILVLFLIAYNFLSQSISQLFEIGSFTLLVSMLGQLRNNTSYITSHIGEIYRHALFAAPFFELMNLPKLIKEDKDAVEVVDKPPLIEFKNVHFTYPNSDREVLKNVSFVINPGKSIAIVGANGAGKTTIIKLLCRFYDVSKGEILINGVNIKKLKLSSWYECLSTLFQEFVKYNFTVKDNIMLGRSSIYDEKRMHEAAIKSGAVSFIKNLKHGYDQMLGKQVENGEELSIGQWQKLVIARALYADAPVLIMDEPTSAIDAQSEYKIFKNLKNSYKGKTLIFVSHRFSTVRNASEIIVLDEGRIIERGTHNKLLEKKGKYAKMFTIQAKGYQ